MYIRPDNYTIAEWTDVANEHFIVWMQMESFPDFIKLYGRIDTDLPIGVYYFLIQSSKCNFHETIFIYFILDYNVKSWGGTKSLLITTSSPLGRASFLGWVLVSASFTNFFIIIILLLCSAKGSTLENLDNLKWN